MRSTRWSGRTSAPCCVSARQSENEHSGFWQAVALRRRPPNPLPGTIASNGIRACLRNGGRRLRKSTFNINAISIRWKCFLEGRPVSHERSLFAGTIVSPTGIDNLLANGVRVHVVVRNKIFDKIYGRGMQTHGHVCRLRPCSKFLCMSVCFDHVENINNPMHGNIDMLCPSQIGRRNCRFFYCGFRPFRHDFRLLGHVCTPFQSSWC
jgi:hypothetical protein